jgi:hypothetical protein
MFSISSARRKGNALQTGHNLHFICGLCEGEAEVLKRHLSDRALPSVLTPVKIYRYAARDEFEFHLMLLGS